jgi:hypothetical protein
VSGDRVEEVEAALRRWIDGVAYASYDIYDGLAGVFPWSLAKHQHLAARVVTQVVKSSPLNLRPLLGIRPHVLAKSLSDLASAAWLRHRAGIDPAAAAQGRALLDRLRADVRPGYAGPCWGLPYAYASRFVDSRAGDPNLFWTINAAIAFVEAWELEGRRADLDTARGTLEFIQRDLGVVDEGEDGVWFRYFAGHTACVYNVAALCGALCRRVAHHTGESALDTLGARALRFVVRNQNPDGSWFYARGPRGRWIDGFHTAYVLESLQEAVLLHGDRDTEPALRRGVEFYTRALFDADAMPRYTAASRYPLDVQNAAQAIQTLARLAWLDTAHRDAAERTAQAVIAQLFHFTVAGERGYFIASRGRVFANRVPFVRWGQAPMLLALDQLLAVRRGVGPSWRAA